MLDLITGHNSVLSFTGEQQGGVGSFCDVSMIPPAEKNLGITQKVTDTKHETVLIIQNEMPG